MAQRPLKHDDKTRVKPIHIVQQVIANDFLTNCKFVLAYVKCNSSAICLPCLVQICSTDPMAIGDLTHTHSTLGWYAIHCKLN